MKNKIFAAICLSLIGVSSAQACIEPYPISMVNKFKEQCSIKDINMVGYCACVISKIQKTVPLGEFIEIGNNKTDVANDKRFAKATKECASKTSSEVNELLEQDKKPSKHVEREHKNSNNGSAVSSPVVPADNIANKPNIPTAPNTPAVVAAPAQPNNVSNPVSLIKLPAPVVPAQTVSAPAVPVTNATQNLPTPANNNQPLQKLPVPNQPVVPVSAVPAPTNVTPNNNADQTKQLPPIPVAQPAPTDNR